MSPALPMELPQQVSLDRQIRCVERELTLRRHVYARRVAAGAMRQGAADEELAAMQAVLETLQAVAKAA